MLKRKLNDTSVRFNANRKVHVIENMNDMNCIHEKKGNKISECNLLHDIINPLKCAKILNRHYYPFLHGNTNNRKCREKFKNLRIILDIVCSYTFVMGRIVEKLHPEKYAVIQWQMKAGNITTNLKVKVDFMLPTLSMMNAVTWKCHVDDSAKGRYNMILVQDLLT